MPFDYEPEPMPIFIGGLNINSADANSSVNIGDNQLQSFHSINKVNSIGQVFGQNNIFTIQPVNSPVVDPDGSDSIMPIATSPLGLED